MWWALSLGLVAAAVVVLAVLAHGFRRRTAQAAMACVYIGVITLCVLMLVQQGVGRVRADLTEENLYTLSEGTREILGDLSVPVTVKLYYSRRAALKAPDQIRQWNNYFLYVQELLRRYEEAAAGRLTLEVIDPRTYTEAEEEAVAYGLRRIPLGQDESFFFGAVAVTELGKTKAIEFFQHERRPFVEYDLTKLISDVTRREKRRVGLLSSLPITGGMSPYMMQMMQAQGRRPQEPWLFVTHLRDSFEVVDVAEDTDRIEEGIDLLVVVHPKDLGEQTLFALDQYVMKGGKLVVFVDAHCLNDEPERDPRNPYAAQQHDPSSNLDALLAGWGVRMAAAEGRPVIAVDPDHAVEIGTQAGRRMPLLGFVELPEGQLSDDAVVTGPLNAVRMLFPGAIERTDEGGTVTELLWTGDEGGAWQPRSPFEVQMQIRNPSRELVLASLTGQRGRKLLGCRITGPLTTNFPEGIEVEDTSPPEPPVPPEAGEEGAPEEADETNTVRLDAVQEAAEGARVYVFADVDMLSDMVAYQESWFGVMPILDNASLALNTLEALSGDESLIRVRSRGGGQRRFEVVDRIEEQAAEAIESEIRAVNEKIAQYERRLSELGQAATEENLAVVQGQALEERREVEREIRAAKKKLRELQARKLEDVEALGRRIEALNTRVPPAVILLIAVVIALVRYVNAKRYAARRARG